MKIATHKYKRLVRVFFEDGTIISGTEHQFMTDWNVQGRDVGQQLIVATGGSFAALADARDRISQAFSAWDAERREWDAAKETQDG